MTVSEATVAGPAMVPPASAGAPGCGDRLRCRPDGSDARVPGPDDSSHSPYVLCVIIGALPRPGPKSKVLATRGDEECFT